MTLTWPVALVSMTALVVLLVLGIVAMRAVVLIAQAKAPALVEHERQQGIVAAERVRQKGIDDQLGTIKGLYSDSQKEALKALQRLHEPDAEEMSLRAAARETRRT